MIDLSIAIEGIKNTYTPAFLLQFILTLAFSIFLHELGHWLFIYRQKNIKLSPKFYYQGLLKWGIQLIYKGSLSNKQKINMYVMGLFFGFVPIVLTLLFSGNLAFIFLLPLYFGGCDYDLKRLITIIQEENINYGDYKNTNKL